MYQPKFPEFWVEWKAPLGSRLGSFENEALENEDRSTKHPNLENEAPKSRKRSTQTSKTKHPRLENEAPKSRNHCRMKDHNFKSCMTQAKPGEATDA